MSFAIKGSKVSCHSSLHLYVLFFMLSMAEYEALDQELDQLNSCLDKLENWNDSLHSRMKDMLENMQKMREEGRPQITQAGNKKEM